MYKTFLPYQKNPSTLEDFKIEFKSEEKSNPPPLNDKWTANIYSINEKRSNKWIMTSGLDTSEVDIWRGKLDDILKQILSLLNNKSDFKWKEIKKYIVDFWHQKQKHDKQEDIAAGGSGKWTSMMDLSLSQLMKFIAIIFGLKWEILKTLPLYLEDELKSKDDFEKQISWMVFDEVIIKNKLQEMSQSSESLQKKTKDAVDYIIEHSKHLNYLHRMDLLDPHYDDEAPLLSFNEKDELNALFELYEEFNQEIDNDKSLSLDEKKLKKYDFWDTETGKRLNELNKRRVYGAGLSFKEKENRKRKVANKIVNDLGFLLIIWGLDFKECKKYYFQLYVKESWKREKRELETRDLINKGESQTELMRQLIKGGWDSNSMTFFGVVVGIIIAVLLGLLSLLISLHVDLLLSILISISITDIILIIFIKLTEQYRIPIIKWVKSILELHSKPKKIHE